MNTLISHTGIGFQDSNGVRLEIGDCVQWSEAGRYTCGGSYSGKGSGRITGCNGCALWIDTTGWESRSVSKFGADENSGSGMKTLHFHGEYNAKARCYGFRGSILKV